ncbi:hypothetical protein [Chryseobacterium sp. Leaf394]|uniref:hypothetical protein n=1 Tax=Chryseobacterium sp. Leaf394 TaxID=1736361 RepID=UPI0006F58247|nr:hypothetical protein [Chryseobacterium sp. Leaf394]KQS92499.1 hypothetical protein ASG21_08675 [Chryseobacterium sp. Leaf394]
MKNKIQIFAASLFVFAFASIFNTAIAQISSDNTIKEVQLAKADAFNEIRNQLMANFDFTNQDYQQGIVNSEVKFDVSENGKIINVKSKGDCKVVSKEIEKILSNLHYRIDSSKMSEKMLASSFVMPVRVDINNR